jgi:uncharacterized alpha-E superfamily protein
MLSRVADSLYWLVRYVERAENLARLVDVNAYDALEAGHVENDDIWRPVLTATCAEEAYFRARENSGGELDVLYFVTLAAGNPDSIRQCIAQARETARMVRDQISEEMWLELNSFHLFMQSSGAERLWRTEPDALLRKVVKFCLLFEGLVEATLLHDEGWQFIQIGKLLERADKTSRVLDMLSGVEVPDRSKLGSALRSCSGLSAFRSEYRGDITLPNVVSFLLFSQSFPRSIRFCLRQLDGVLHGLSGMPAGTFSNEAERLTGSVLAQLNFSSLDSVWAAGLHQYVDALQVQFNSIGQQVFETYVLLPSEIQNLGEVDSLPLQRHQQIQQQQ